MPPAWNGEVKKVMCKFNLLFFSSISPGKEEITLLLFISFILRISFDISRENCEPGRFEGAPQVARFAN